MMFKYKNQNPRNINSDININHRMKNDSVSSFKVSCPETESPNLEIFQRNRSFFGKISDSHGQCTEVSVHVPCYFNSIPNDKLMYALSRHRPIFGKNQGQVVSVNFFLPLLGGGQVSSKVLLTSNTPRSSKKRAAMDVETRVKELNQQIADVNQVIEEWKNKYYELEAEEKTKKIEKIIEVPVENVQIVEKPKIIKTNADEKINELQKQIEGYEKRILDWKKKFYTLDETVQNEMSTLQEDQTIDTSGHQVDIDSPEEIEVEDEKDLKRLKVLKEKIKSMQDFSVELQKKCISMESRCKEKTIQVPVEVVTYVERPVETVVYDNDNVETLKAKVAQLNQTLAEWKGKYEEYEKDLVEVDVEPVIVHRTNVKPEPFSYIEEEEDSAVVKLKEDLDRLRETLKEFQSRCTETQEEVIEKIIEVPIEVIKYVERPIEVIKTDDTKAKELQSQIAEIQGTIAEWKAKYTTTIQKSSSKQIKKSSQAAVVNVNNSFQEVEDKRMTELQKNVDQLKGTLAQWEMAYQEISDKEQTVFEKTVEVKVPVTKYIEREIEVHINDETKINELKAKIQEANQKLEDIKSRPKDKPKKKTQVVENIVEVPNEVIRYIDRKVEKLVVDDDRIASLLAQLNELHQTLSEWEKKCNDLQQREVKVNEKIQEVPVERIKYIDRPVYVSVVDEEKLKQVTDEYEKLQNALEMWQEKYKTLQQREPRYVEKYVEVPKEVIQYIDKPVEVLVVDQQRLKELNAEYKRLTTELSQVKAQANKKKVKKQQVVDKYVEVPTERTEVITVNIEILLEDETKIQALTEEIDALGDTLRGLQDKYEELESREVKIQEKIIEVPVEVIEYLDKPVVIKQSDNFRIKDLQKEYDRLTREIKDVQSKTAQVQKRKTKTVTKYVDVPIEKIQYVDKYVDVVKVDDAKLRELSNEYAELCTTLTNWKTKYDIAAAKQQKVIETVLEEPVEVIEYIDNEVVKYKVDEKKIRELQNEYSKLVNSIESLKEQCIALQQRKPKVTQKTVENLVEVSQYIDQKSEVLIVDEERLSALQQEIKSLTARHEDLGRKYQDLSKSTVNEIIRKVEVPREVVEFIEYDVEITKVDDSKANALALEIEELTNDIRQWQEKYNALPKTEIQVANKIVEVPVEVIEYEDTVEDVVSINPEILNEYKETYAALTKELQTIQNEIAGYEKEKGIEVEKIIKVPREILQTYEREVEVIKVDETKMNKLQRDLDKLNEKLNICNEAIDELQNIEQQVIEKKAEIPVDKIIYVDKEVQVVKYDDERIKMLKDKIKNLEAEVKSYKPPLSKKKTMQNKIVEVYVDEPYETVKKVDRKVEVVHIDDELFAKVQAEYNQTIDELAVWKKKFLELENQEPKIVERYVDVPIEKIEYVDIVNEVVKEDKEKISELEEELRQLNDSLAYWKAKSTETETVKRRVVDIYVDVPFEKIEYVDKVIEVVQCDEEKIKSLSEQYASLTLELQKVKCEYENKAANVPTIVEKIIEVPEEVIIYVDKEVEVVKVDQDRLNELTMEYNKIIDEVVNLSTPSIEEEVIDTQIYERLEEVITERIEYEDEIIEEWKEDEEKIRALEEDLAFYTAPVTKTTKKTQKIVKKPPVILEKKVEMPYNVIQYIDHEVEIVKYDEARERELIDQIALTKNQIDVLKENYAQIEQMKPQVIKNIVEVPVEVIEYVDTPVEVMKYDDKKIASIENGLIDFRKNLISWLDKYEAMPQDDEGTIYVKAKIPKQSIKKPIESATPAQNDDNTRIDNISNEITELKGVLLEISETFKRLETQPPKITEKIVKVPVEVIKYVDKPYEVIKEDDTRIRELEREISNIQKRIEDYSSTTTFTEEIHKEILQAVNILHEDHETRPKESYRDDQNIEPLQLQIDEINNNIRQWKKKYEELCKRDRKVIERTFEVPVEVIQYFDKRIEIVKKDDKRIQSLEKELKALSEQWSDWQMMVSEESETTLTSRKKTKKSSMDVVESLPKIVKQNPECAELEERIGRFVREFERLNKNINDLEKMEKIIIGKIVEVPKEIAEYIDYNIEVDDTRPQQCLRDIQTMSAKLEAWKSGIQNKVTFASNLKYEKKISTVENLIDDTPKLVRDSSIIEELEEELNEITQMISEYETKAEEISEEKEEIIETTVQVKKDIVKEIDRIQEVIVKDTRDEEYIQRLIKETKSAIDMKKSDYNKNKTKNVEYIDKVIQVQKEVLKTVKRNVELVKYDDRKIQAVEAKYSKLQMLLDDLIENCQELEQNEVTTIEKIIEVPMEYIKKVERAIKVEKIDERPILEIIEKLNNVTQSINEYRSEASAKEDIEVEYVENIIKVPREIVKYEMKTLEVPVYDQQPIADLEERKAQLNERIAYWQKKVAALENTCEKVIEKVIEVPVKKVKTVYRNIPTESLDDKSLYELVEEINRVNCELTVQTIEYSKIDKEKAEEEVKVVERPREVIKKIENIIERIVWDTAPIKALEKKIKDIEKEIEAYSEEASTTETNVTEATQNVTRVKKEVKKYIVRDSEKIIIDETPVKALREEIATLTTTMNDWKNKLSVLKSEKAPIIEKKIEIDRERIIKKKRKIEVPRYDERPIRKAIAEIEKLQIKIDDVTNRTLIVESKKVKSTEKIIEVPVDVTVYQAKKNEVVKLNEVNIDQMIKLKKKLLSDLSEWKAKVKETEKKKVVKQVNTIEVPKKVVKTVKRVIENQVYDDTQTIEWEEKIIDMREEIKAASKKKVEAMKGSSKIIEKVKQVPYDVVVYEESRKEIVKWDDIPIKILEKNIATVSDELKSAEAKRKALEVEKKKPITKIIEIPKEVIKKVNRVKEKIVWDDSEIHRLEEKITGLVAQINEKRIAPSTVEDDTPEVTTKIVKVPKEIIVYQENLIEEVVYDNTPIESVKAQIKSLVPEIAELKKKTNDLSKRKQRIVEKIIPKEVEMITKVENVIQSVIYDDRKIISLQKQIESSRQKQEEFRSKVITRKTFKEEVVENVIEVKREIVKKVDRIKEMLVYDRTREKELQQKINELNSGISEYKTNIKKIRKSRSSIQENLIKVKKQVKVYKDRIVERVREDKTLLREMENKIKNARTKLKISQPKIKSKPSRKIEKKERVIKVPKEVVKKVIRPIKVVKYDETRVKDLEKKITVAKRKYVPVQAEIQEIIEEEGDVIEKIIEVPKKIVQKIDRNIEVVRWDDSRIKNLEKELAKLQTVPEDLTKKIQDLIAKKNTVKEITEERKVEVVKYIPRKVQVEKTNDSFAEVYQSNLEQLKENLQNVIENYNNLKNIDKQYLVKTVEVPYETIRYVEKEIEVYQVNFKKVSQLESKFQRLKDIESDIREKITEVEEQKSRTIDRVKVVQFEKVVYVDRPVRNVKIDNTRLEELETQFKEASAELASWQKQCEQYDIIKEKIIEVPKQVIKEVEYPVEVIKAEQEIVDELAQEISVIKTAMAQLEIKHNNLVELQSQEIEKIVEVPKQFVTKVNREINVMKLDREKINQLNDQVKQLKTGLAKGQKDIKIKRKVIEKHVGVEEEVVKYIDQPIEVISLNRKTMRDIEDKFNKAYALLETWQERYRELLDEKFTPEEQVIEMEIQKKKFGIKRTERLIPNEKEIKRLTEEVNRMNNLVEEYKSQINEVRNSLKQRIVKETVVQVPQEKIVYVEVPTEIISIDANAERTLRSELKKLRAAASSLRRK